MEKDIEVYGKSFRFETTYDGDSQYNVQVRSGEKVITSFKVSAEDEQELYESAAAHFKADIDLRNVDA